MTLHDVQHFNDIVEDYFQLGYQGKLFDFVPIVELPDWTSGRAETPCLCKSTFVWQSILEFSITCLVAIYIYCREQMKNAQGGWVG
jgi:hypothetical protein